MVDDKSSDAGPEQVQRFCQYDSRFRFLRCEGDVKGACVCRNLGIKASTGEFVVFLDSDDLLGRDCLAGRLQVLAQNPGADMVVAQALLFDKEPGDSVAMWNRAEFETNDLIERFLNQDMPWANGGVLWRRSALNAVGLWNTDLACFQDWEFHIRACTLGLKIVVHPVPDFYVRRSDAVPRISRMHNVEPHVESRIKAMETVCGELTDRNAWKQSLRAAAKGFLIRNYLSTHTQGLPDLANRMLQGRSGRSLIGICDRILLRWIASKGDVWRWDTRVNRVASIVWRGIAYNDMELKNGFMSEEWKNPLPQVDVQVAG